LAKGNGYFRCLFTIAPVSLSESIHNMSLIYKIKYTLIEIR
jgi:hypothetical protein